MDWKEEYANDPRLHLTAEDIPTIDELRYEGSVDEGLWYAESDDGFASYFAWDGGAAGLMETLSTYHNRPFSTQLDLEKQGCSQSGAAPGTNHTPGTGKSSPETSLPGRPGNKGSNPFSYTNDPRPPRDPNTVSRPSTYTQNSPSTPLQPEGLPTPRNSRCKPRMNRETEKYPSPNWTKSQRPKFLLDQEGEVL